MSLPATPIAARDLASDGRSRGLLARLRSIKLVAALWRLAPALAPPLLFLPVVLAPPLNHDVAAVLQFSQRWLAGEHLYADLIDVNPPLIFVLNLIPAAIAAVTPLDAIQALQFCILALGAGCWWLAVRVRDRAAEGPVERTFLDVLPLLVLLGAGYDFGQREHLMAVAAVPYLMLAERRGRAVAVGCSPRVIAIGLIAGVGFALKPHFLAVPAPGRVHRVCGAQPRRLAPGAGRDPARCGAVADGGGVGGLPGFAAPGISGLSRHCWCRWCGISTSTRGGLSAWQVLLVPRLATVLCLLAPLLWLNLRRPLLVPGALLPRLLAMAALGALASAVAQHKGWSYHIVPIELFSGALGGLIAAGWLDRLGIGFPAPARIAAGLAALVMLYGISNGEAPWKEIGYGDEQVAGLTALLDEYAAGERVLVLSPGINPIFPALNYAHVKSSLRTMNMWLLEGAYQQCLPDGRRYRNVWEMGRAEFFVYRTVAEDFARAPPAVVVVDRQPGIPWCGAEFSFIDYFRRHPLFAEVWSHYQLTAEWDRYRVYTRKD